MFTNRGNVYHQRECLPTEGMFTTIQREYLPPEGMFSRERMFTSRGDAFAANGGNDTVPGSCASAPCRQLPQRRGRKGLACVAKVDQENKNKEKEQNGPWGGLRFTLGK